jgi:opacity protein-like surface antigen
MKKTLTLLLTAAAAASATAGTTTTDYSKQIQTPVTETLIGMGWYVAPFGGGNVAQSDSVDNARVHAFGTTYDAHASLGRSVGFVLGLKGGYVFDTHSWFLPAVELEGFYDNVDVKLNGYAGDATGHVKATMQSGNYLLNVYGKFNLGRFRPYIGAGAGAAYIYGSDFSGDLDIAGHSVVTFKSAADAAHYDHFRRDTWDFAWQAIGGADYYFTPKVSIFAEYKALWYYINSDGVGPYLQHLVVGGFRIHF